MSENERKQAPLDVAEPKSQFEHFVMLIRSGVSPEDASFAVHVAGNERKTWALTEGRS